MQVFAAELLCLCKPLLTSEVVWVNSDRKPAVLCFVSQQARYSSWNRKWSADIGYKAIFVQLVWQTGAKKEVF